MSNSVGRPKITFYYYLRLVAWAHFVECGIRRSGNPGQMKDLTVLRKSGSWGCYMRGDSGPRSALSQGSNSLVSTIDREAGFSGSASFFYHPFWDLLDFSELVTPAEMKSLSLKLDDKLWRQFVRYAVTSEGNRVGEMFWYRAPDHEKFPEQLGKHITLDNLAASLICARMSYLSQDMVAFQRFFSASFRLMEGYSEREFFNDNRMRSLRLLIEADWLAQLTSLHEPKGNVNQSERRSISIADDLEYDWELRCTRHRGKLSPSSGLIFSKWLAFVSPELARKMDLPGFFERQSKNVNRGKKAP